VRLVPRAANAKKASVERRRAWGGRVRVNKENLPQDADVSSDMGIDVGRADPPRVLCFGPRRAAAVTSGEGGGFVRGSVGFGAGWSVKLEDERFVNSREL
jgi:hypothetical protein